MFYPFFWSSFFIPEHLLINCAKGKKKKKAQHREKYSAYSLLLKRLFYLFIFFASNCFVVTPKCTEQHISDWKIAVCPPPQKKIPWICLRLRSNAADMEATLLISFFFLAAALKESQQANYDETKNHDSHPRRWNWETSLAVFIFFLFNLLLHCRCRYATHCAASSS